VVSAGGKDFNALISGGTQALSAGSTVSATVAANGLQLIFSRGVTSRTTIAAGGEQQVGSGGTNRNARPPQDSSIVCQRERQLPL
jgi:autotransporter passenger strand-loop-strand repeat protein